MSPRKNVDAISMTSAMALVQKKTPHRKASINTINKKRGNSDLENEIGLGDT